MCKESCDIRWPHKWCIWDFWRLYKSILKIIHMDKLSKLQIGSKTRIRNSKYTKKFLDWTKIGHLYNEKMLKYK
jgi:hypothetical protein